MQVVENVHVVPEVRANTYVLVDLDGVTLIDAGLPGSAKKILAYLAGLGKSPSDVKRIILTHSDWDHIGSLAALHKATGARTYASQIEAEAIGRGKPSRPPQSPPNMGLGRRLMRLFMSPRPFMVDEIIKIDQVLPILGGLRVVDSTGHTPGHVSLYAPSVGVLFCGDSMVTDEGVIHGSRPGLTWDPAKAQESVRRQAALGATIVCSGHGPVVKDAQGKFPL